MTAIAVLNCIKCNKPGKKMWFLPHLPPKKTKKGMTFNYTFNVWLCGKHNKELNEWIWKEEK